MNIVDGKDNLLMTVFHQLDSIWREYDKEKITNTFEKTLLDMEYVLSNINKNNKYVWKSYEKLTFTYFNSVQYSIFLYLLSHNVFKKYGGG